MVDNSSCRYRLSRTHSQDNHVSSPEVGVTDDVVMGFCMLTSLAPPRTSIYFPNTSEKHNMLYYFDVRSAFSGNKHLISP